MKLLALFSLLAAPLPIPGGSMMVTAPLPETQDAPAFELEEDASIIILGNTFAERMNLFGWFETFLHCRFPGHRLRVRNLGWSGDEVGLMPRPTGFASLNDDLARHDADLIFLCFGMNEAFPPGRNLGHGDLGRFQGGLDQMVTELLEHRYNGESAPHIVLVSPIASEALDGQSGLAAHRARLGKVTRLMAELAQERGLSFVDLHTPTSAVMQAGATSRREGHAVEPMTINGLHLTSAGYQRVGLMLAQGLGLCPGVTPPRAAEAAADASVAALREAVHAKNHTFFLHWHGPNMEYVHGRRRDLGGGLDMPEERARLERITGELEERVWGMQKPAPESVWSAPIPETPPWATPIDYAGLETPTGEATERDFDDHGEVGKPNEPEKARLSFKLPDGYAINLYASEREFPIANPVAMNFDAQGRLWVANSPTWPHPKPGIPPLDSIVVLEDTDGDGDADEHAVFVEGLHMIHGFALGDGGAYISQTPNVIHARDVNGDKRADRFEVLLHGFGGEDVEHSINNYEWGPDGALYFMEGIFFHTQVETPYGPRRLVDGGVFRWEPGSGRFDVQLSYAFWNPWGLVFDEWGASIVLDASSHDYFPTSTLAARYVYPKQKHNQHAELSFAPAGLGPGAGLELLHSRHFPDEVQGRLLANQLSHGFRGTRWHDLSIQGTTYQAQEQPPLLQSEDPSFRPLALTLGPDGALYVLDFYSYLIENTSDHKRDPGRDHEHGRVWRISCPDRPLLTPPRISGASRAELLGHLAAHEQLTRQLARRELMRHSPSKIVDALRSWLKELDPEHLGQAQHQRLKLEALWIYQELGEMGHGAVLLEELLQSPLPQARAAALRTLRAQMDRIDGAFEHFDWKVWKLRQLERLVEDDDPRVRLEAVLTCGFEGSKAARNIALLATKHPLDRGLRQALDETMDFFDRMLDEGN